jgi:hypothetical protein
MRGSGPYSGRVSRKFKLSHPRDKLPSMDGLRDLAASQDAVFTIDHARAFGLTEKEIRVRRERDWLCLYDGVYIVAGAPRTPRAMIRAACLAGAPNAAASHRSAAALHGLPGGRQDIAEVTCPRWMRTTQSGLIVHESKCIEPSDVQEIDGIAVTRPERALIELASIYKSADFIELVLHAMLRKKVGTIASTIDVFNRLAKRGRPGVAVVRAVLSRWDPTVLAVPESPPETTLLQILRDAGLGRVVPQLVVREASGTFVARVDIGLPDLRVTVEYDSDQEHTNPITIANDNDRRNAVIRAGWFPLVARRRDLRDEGRHLIAAIRALCSQPA